MKGGQVLKKLETGLQFSPCSLQGRGWRKAEDPY